MTWLDEYLCEILKW